MPAQRRAASTAPHSVWLALLVFPVLAAGCFRECSFPLREGELTRLDPPPAALPEASARALAPAGSAREWLQLAAPQLQPLLPDPSRPVLLTGQMAHGPGRPVDVYAHFGRDMRKMQGLFSNFWAIQHTAQAIEPGYAIENAPTVWPGFRSVWIPVAPEVENHGFLGLAQADGRPRRSDCIVVLPGLFGDNGARRSQDVCEALLKSGFHVLALEPRAHGQTEARYPNVYCNYGVREVPDLMRVSEWLQDHHPQVRRTGLIGFCWGANQALLAAWYDGRSADDPNITPALARWLGPPSSRRHFEAGVLAFSPVLRWEHFLDRMATPKSVWLDPAPAMFQVCSREHMARKGFPEVTGDLRTSIAYDIAYSGATRHFPLADGYRFLRLMPYREHPSGDKLESARVPTLIVHSVNDPLQTAQEVADLIADTSNPNLAAIMLPGGGHIGFQAFARRYFYSLMVNFFDPALGPAVP